MEITILILLIVVIGFLIALLVRKPGGDNTLLSDELNRLKSELADQDQRQRNELNDNFKRLSEELSRLLKEQQESQRDFSDRLFKKMQEFTDRQQKSLELSRTVMDERMEKMQESGRQQANDFNELIIKRFQHQYKQLEDHADRQLKSFEKIRETVDQRLKDLQQDNNEKLEKMRKTVDEKLQTTLEKRLGESFKQVSERLELVHSGLGEMKKLASGVGDLKKVLSNVKTRGVLGEYQLGNILEQLLTPDQYDRNVQTRKGSRNHVEFAVKLPGRDQHDEVVYLPIDSKFPMEDYEVLLQAMEGGIPEEIDRAEKVLLKKIESFAKDISEKYIDPPHTTDFAIMFLPVESLYGEVLRHPGLFETLQKKYKITVTGPTTLSALLNSLQMGFRTLAVQRKSSEVWDILRAVQSEFGKFSDYLAKVRKQLHTASSSLDELTGTRTRAMQRKLKNVEIMDNLEARKILGIDAHLPDIDEEEEADEKEED